MRLFEALKVIRKEALISFHMPGHKNGRLIGDFMKAPLDMDITEIPGADHLHDAHGCIEETENALSKFYGSAQSKLLVGGSTSGILSMILGTTVPGEQLIINRNAHLSAYNAIQLGKLTPIYVMPVLDENLSIPLGFDLEVFKNLIQTHPEAKACLLTYPTYEGVCYPIEEMIELCHRHGMIVLVDEAHGAHLKLNSEGPPSSLECGADVVVQSFHKTLPAMTQVACLHVGKHHHLSQRQLKSLMWHLRALQSSSPSYILMASADLMLSVIEKEGAALTADMIASVKAFYKATEALKTMTFKKFENGDPGKLLLEVEPAYFQADIWDGFAIEKLLRETYGIQVEYATRHMCLFMASLANTESDFDHLAMALIEMDKVRGGQIVMGTQEKTLNGKWPCPERVVRAFEAALMETEAVTVELCAGRIAAEYVIPYPPGIPIVVPGERIPESLVPAIACEKTEINVLR